jgi:hypothetical protein
MALNCNGMGVNVEDQKQVRQSRHSTRYRESHPNSLYLLHLTLLSPSKSIRIVVRNDHSQSHV